jgi:hypothetical protein
VQVKKSWTLKIACLPVGQHQKYKLVCIAKDVGVRISSKWLLIIVNFCQQRMVGDTTAIVNGIENGETQKLPAIIDKVKAISMAIVHETGVNEQAVEPEKKREIRNESIPNYTSRQPDRTAIRA